MPHSINILFQTSFQRLFFCVMTLPYLQGCSHLLSTAPVTASANSKIQTAALNQITSTVGSEVVGLQ